MNKTVKTQRNIIANEMGLNRPEVERLILQVVNDRIDKTIKDGKLRGWIEDQVHRSLNAMAKDGRHDYHSIRSIVHQEAEKALREKLVVSLR